MHDSSTSADFISLPDTLFKCLTFQVVAIWSCRDLQQICLDSVKIEYFENMYFSGVSPVIRSGSCSILKLTEYNWNHAASREYMALGLDVLCELTKTAPRVYSQVCTWSSLWHFLQLTVQHHLKRHWQFSVIIIFLMRAPLPQQSSWHPPTPILVSLHCLPTVPCEPKEGSALQKFGESVVYTKSSSVGGFIVSPSLINLSPLLLIITLIAPSKRAFKRSPTSLKWGIFFQHVFTEQEPERPWHLHSVCM